MKHTARFATACAALYGLMFCLSVQATDVSTKPLKADVLVKPNVIFGMDDSGSMDWEQMLDTTEGVMWLDTSTTPPTAWNSNGTPRSSSTGYRYNYLFPIGHAPGAQSTGYAYTSAVGGAGYGYSSGTTWGHAAPPTPQFAALRSSAYNPIYYDTTRTYEPWAPAYHNGAAQTYGNATPSAARASPHLTGSATMNLTVDQAVNTNIGYQFLAHNGHYIPTGSRVCSNTSTPCTSWNSATTSETTLSGGPKMVTIPYYPATFWHVQSCSPVSDATTSNCVYAPGSSTVTLRRYEIKSGNTFPSGRTYTAEMQNFANWWQYYRKRRHMLAGAMGEVMEGLTGMRLGVVRFNNRTTVTMYDIDGPVTPVPTPAMRNAQLVAGVFYTNPANSATPTRETLQYIGNQFHTNTNVIQSACQRNAAFIVTDGFANASGAIAGPAYSQATYGSGWPYEVTSSNSLGDLALSYYTTRLRNTAFTAGRVPLGDQTVQNPDSNPDLHMNTYGVMLGIRGTIWPGITDAWANSFTWPVVTASGDRGAIDDLWHATINGRGKMYMATNPVETAVSIQAGLNDMLDNVGAQSSVAVSSVNLRRGDGKAYLGIYNPKGWTGDITANAVNPSTGEISTTVTWSAATRLLAKNWTTRVIATSVGGVGVPFTAANVGTIVNPGNIYGVTADVINYLRGDRTYENTSPAEFRRRLSLMAAVLNARPAVSGADHVVYAPSSEGMVHALDSDTGEELWAYVPGSALSEMGKQTSRTWSFETYLDGSPQLYTVGTRKILIGGRGSAGGGYYALDVTNPRGLTEASLASRVLWEFPTTQAITTSGLSVGQPVVVRTANYGTVALITQGYNGTADGIGRLHMINAVTGALIHTFQANSGEPTLDPGLAQVTGLVENNGEVRYVYGGDERGNLWRFDLQTRGTPMHMALLRDAASNRQPITAAPTLVEYHGQNIVLVGTGRLLGLADFGSTQVQSFFAIKDTGTDLTNPRSSLTPRTLNAEDANGERDLSGAAFNWDTDRGWYFDLPAGQQANTDPAALFGAVVFTTNMVAMTDCSASSYFYAVDIVSGMNFAPADGATSYASARIGDFTVSAVTPLGYDGRGQRDFGVTFQRSTTRGNVGLGNPGEGCRDGSSACTRNPPLRLPDMRRKNSWRQVQRQ